MSTDDSTPPRQAIVIPFPSPQRRVVVESSSPVGGPDRFEKMREITRDFVNDLLREIPRQRAEGRIDLARKMTADALSHARIAIAEDPCALMRKLEDRRLMMMLECDD